MRALGAAVLCAISAIAHAQPPAKVVGANEIMRVTTPAGFIDDPVAYHGQRLAYVVAESGTKAALHVVQLGCTKCLENKEQIVVDLAPVTLRPAALRLVGTRVFVIGATEDGMQIAALVDLAKKAPVYKLGPANHITLVSHKGAIRAAVHEQTSVKAGTRHVARIFDLETGRKIAGGKPFELVDNHHKKLEFKVNHWGEGYTRAYGIKGGEWIKKENQRSPDTEGTYDLIAGKVVDTRPIGDLFEQRKRFGVLADAAGKLDFVAMSWDNAAVQVWSRGQLRAVELDQPISTYDPKSLQGVVEADGSAWFTLRVDPVNPEAVARKKADPEYVDIFRAATNGKAVRKARVLGAGLRHRFGVAGDHPWLLERSSGSDRGGNALVIYALQ